MENKKLVIGHLFPDLLNMYSDRGNILALQNRLLWRGIDAEVIEFCRDDELDITNLDIVFIGGASDREQQQALDKLRPVQSELKAYVENGGVMLAVCGGYPLVGTSCSLQGETVEGLSLVDIRTEASEKRAIGNVVIEACLDGKTMKVVGFENHGTKTYLGESLTLGKVLSGHGNNGQDSTCGVVYKNLVGTYLHGPLLPKNPDLTDYLLQKALQNKYGEESVLAPLFDVAEERAHDYAVNRFSK